MGRKLTTFQVMAKAISLKTHKILWGRAANRCAIPDCRRELVAEATQNDGEAVVGEECHIIAHSNNGPRGNALFDLNQRDEYSNLILLCNVHHKIVDDQPNTFTVEVLRTMKANHEAWIHTSLQVFDAVKQRDDELYATYIDEWAVSADLSDWTDWSSGILSDGQPSIFKTRYERLFRLMHWSFARVWPGRYPELEAAFTNFNNVLSDFLTIFSSHLEKDIDRGERIRTEKFYSKRFIEQDQYQTLLHQYNYHVDLVQDLMLELTRATNYICDRVRHFIDPTFRVNEGLLVIEFGPDRNLQFRRCHPQYRDEERTLQPYPSLEIFKIERQHRDYRFSFDKTS